MKRRPVDVYRGRGSPAGQAKSEAQGTKAIPRRSIRMYLRPSPYFKANSGTCVRQSKGQEAIFSFPPKASLGLLWPIPSATSSYVTSHASICKSGYVPSPWCSDGEK